MSAARQMTAIIEREDDGFCRPVTGTRHQVITSHKLLCHLDLGPQPQPGFDGGPNSNFSKPMTGGVPGS